MTHPTLDLIARRTSVNHFDPAYAIEEATIRELVRYAVEAPSAYNFQNWRFIAVRTPAHKARLCDMAYGQQKVRDASVTFIVCGRLNPHLGLRNAMQPFSAAGHVDAAAVDAMVESATSSYDGEPRGRAAAGNWPRKPRRPVSDVLAIV